jgi:hypothetical protein
MVHAPDEHSRGCLRDHYLSRRKCANVASTHIYIYILLCVRLIYSFYSRTLYVRGERPCYGIMIGGSLRSSHSSSSELLVSSHLFLMSRWRFPNYVVPGAGGVDLGLYLHTIFKSSDQALQEGTGVKQGDARAAILIAPTLATNLLSTLLIGIQAWWVVNSASVWSLFWLNERAQEKTRRVVWLSQQEKPCHQG